MKELSDLQAGKTLFTCLMIDDPSRSLTFGLGLEGELISAFATKTKIQGDGTVSNEVFNLNGVLEMRYSVSSDGIRDIEYIRSSGINSAYGVESWWRRFDHCVGELNGPTPSNTANVFLGIILNSATLGLYTPVTLVACAGVASLSKD